MKHFYDNHGNLRRVWVVCVCVHYCAREKTLPVYSSVITAFNGKLETENFSENIRPKVFQNLNRNGNKKLYDYQT